jgi:hypothetical protein
LYFAADGDAAGEQLWRFDPATGIATRLSDNFAGSPTRLTSFGGALYFWATEDRSQMPKLWTYDGGGVKKVADLLSGSELFVFGGDLYFGADDGLHGYELWKIPAPIAGDANGDGRINPDDYFAIDLGFASHLTGYAHGDFNRSGGAPDGDDYFVIDQAFLHQGAPLGGAQPSALLPASDLDWFDDEGDAPIF